MKKAALQKEGGFFADFLAPICAFSAYLLRTAEGCFLPTM